MNNRDGWICLIWATLQQAVVASSTYFIVEAGRLAAARDFHGAVRYAAAFAGSLLVVYVPTTISLAYIQKWRLSSFENFLASFIAVNAGKTTWSHQRDKAVHEPWLTNEALNVYGSATDLIYQFYSIFLSFVLNIGVIALLLDARISAWYAGASLVLFVSNKLFSGKVAEVSLFAQSARNGLSRALLSAWENIFTGNRYNLERWQEQAANNLSAARAANVRYDVTRSLIGSATVSVAILLIGAGNAIYLRQYRTEPAMISALLITFPRQLQTIQNIFAFFNLYLGWAGVREQLARLSEVVKVGESGRDVEKYVKYPDIRLARGNDEKNLGGLGDLLAEVGAASGGRYTLRGRNGIGKSTLLSLVAERTGDRSFYLPSKIGDLAFAASETVVESDGNRLLAAMKEIAALPGVQLLLLDEWDANLDAENLRLVDMQIEALSRRMTVVESRHRGA
jgi:hypothetical protein